MHPPEWDALALKQEKRKLLQVLLYCTTSGVKVI
jgi:hypothetical protein